MRAVSAPRAVARRARRRRGSAGAGGRARSGVAHARVAVLERGRERRRVEPRRHPDDEVRGSATRGSRRPPTARGRAPAAAPTMPPAAVRARRARSRRTPPKRPGTPRDAVGEPDAAAARGRPSSCDVLGRQADVAHAERRRARPRAGRPPGGRPRRGGVRAGVLGRQRGGAPVEQLLQQLGVRRRAGRGGRGRRAAAVGVGPARARSCRRSPRAAATSAAARRAPHGTNGVARAAPASRPASQRRQDAPTSAIGPSWRRPPCPANAASSGTCSRVWSVPGCVGSTPWSAVSDEQVALRVEPLEPLVDGRVDLPAARRGSPRRPCGGRSAGRCPRGWRTRARGRARRSARRRRRQRGRRCRRPGAPRRCRRRRTRRATLPTQWTGTPAACSSCR